MRRRLALLLAVALLSASCFGSFQLTRTIWKFNRDIGGKWGQEVLFLALIIIPVYEVTLLVDGVVFNTSEFWAGRTTSPGFGAGLDLQVGAERVVALADGTELRLAREGEDTLRVSRGDEVRFFRRTVDGMEARDEEGNVLATARGAPNGDVVVTDASGSRTYSAEEVALVGRSATSVAAWAVEQVRQRQEAATQARQAPAMHGAPRADEP
ncbi:MAG TPA: DUF3332 family protein [Vulgatibacter sp.]|nr:DUF3332 family protein [Vulgatibacter sp.]